MAYDLCQIPQAAKPFFIEQINTNIYSVEELCFYIYENIYLIDTTFMNEALCDWLRDEFGMKRLYRVLYEQLEKQDDIGAFILPIFREIGYLDSKRMKRFQDELGRLQVQPGDTRQKLKGDYLVRSGMYGSAVTEYVQILDRQGPGNLGAMFYAEIWNNLGCAYARMFRFEQASECFLKAWKTVRTKDALRKYVSSLPLYLDDAAYRKRLGELGADRELIERIQDYNLKICQEAGKAGKKHLQDADPGQQLEQLKTEYRRSSGCLL